MRKWSAQLRVLPFALLFLLTSCAVLTPPARPPGQVPSGAAATRDYYNAIDLGGRLSVRYQNNGKEEALHGSFAWIQNPDHIRVTLLSPLGQTIAVIEVTPEGASLIQGGQAVRSAAEVDRLVEQTLGWPLPVSGLREWLQGFGTGANGRRFIATPDAQEFTTQDNWRIRYVSWQDESNSPSRPKRIDLNRTTAEAGNVSIRAVLDTWQPR